MGKLAAVCHQVTNNYFNNRNANVVLSHRLFARFAAAAKLRPDASAVSAGDVTISFRTLDLRVSALALDLVARGVTPGCTVAVHLPRDATLAVGILGILRAGACYVPLDPLLPDARLALMVAESRPHLALSLSTLRKAALADVQVVELDLLAQTLTGVESVTASAHPIAYADPRHPLYTIFTSGSTGTPKGVQIAGSSVEWLLDALERTGVVRPEHARVAWNASIGFDASVQQWIRLCRGDHLFMIDEQTRLDSGAMVEFLHRHRINDIDITPSHALAILDELERSPLQGLRLIIGGEPIGPTLWNRLRKLHELGMDAVNVYGPTEATVDVTQAAIVDTKTSTLGHVLPGVTVRILDASRGDVALGQVGELAIGGPSVALGYVGQPGMTASRFVPDAAGKRLYLTGDLVRRRGDGTLDYLGRADGQVKVRGHRVELAEVEAVLLAHPGVQAAAVVLRVDGSALSVALVIAPPTTIKTVASYIAALLPDWMRPTDWIVCDSLPLNANGKLDRERVRLMFTSVGTLAPPLPATSEADSGDSSVAAQVTRIWMEVLRRPLVLPQDDFFVLGGNSLAAMQISSRLQAHYHRRVPTRYLFDNPTLAAYIDVMSPYLEG
jgi:amino acid adenylation domain-containing protein